MAYLVCNPYSTSVPQPSIFKLIVNGGAVESIPETLPDGSKRLHYDLSGSPAGHYVIHTVVHNSFGDSSSASIEFDMFPPSTPEGLTLED